MDSSSASAEAVIDLVFSKLSLVYGRDFLGRWEGLDIAEVKADWRRELRGFLLQNPGAIRHALEHLPAGRAPDVLQFRDLCRGAPVAAPAALAAPAADPARVSAALQRARCAVMSASGMSWADRLRARQAAGEALGLMQRETLRRVSE